MAEDNTPTVAAHRHAPSPHMCLRIDTAKRLLGLAKRAKAQKKENSTGADMEEHSQVKSRPAKVKKIPPNKLANLPRPAAKFRKRQLNRTCWSERSSSMDMSYMPTVGLEGVEVSIYGLLKALGLGAENGKTEG
ncbi:MAG: hypothetical protein M1813_003519 [Trichoglossum hirsutum]|nr:MAG: hypothetical protein M1813_003519 [Trichoglossum hirsutum]